MEVSAAEKQPVMGYSIAHQAQNFVEHRSLQTPVAYVTNAASVALDCMYSVTDEIKKEV
jgi:hypothetical protein